MHPRAHKALAATTGFLRAQALPLLALAGATLGALSIRGYAALGPNTEAAVPPILARLDPSLFHKDYCIQEMLRPGPRMFFETLVTSAVHAGIGDVTRVFLVLFVAAYASYIFGLGKLGAVAGSRLAGAFLAFLGLAATKGTIGNIDIIHFINHFEPAIVAMAIGIWGLVACFRERWVLGYALFGIASLFQFLVGFLPGALIAPALLLQAYQKRSAKTAWLPFALFAGGLAATFLPMILAGSTSTDRLSNTDFVYIYAHVRVPHHVLPSAWPDSAWWEIFYFSAAGIPLVLASKTLSRAQKSIVFSVIACAALALLVSHMFIDVWPVAIVAKLQLARSTAFSKLVVLLVTAIVAAESIWNKREGLAVPLILAPIAPFSGEFVLHVALATLAVVAVLGDRRPRWVRVTTWIVGGLTLWYFFSFDGHKFAGTAAAREALAGPRFVGGPILLLVVAIPLLVDWLLQWKPSRRYLPWVLASAAALGSVGLGLALRNPPKPYQRFFTRGIALETAPGSPVDRIARRFRDVSPVDAMVIVPPGVAGFQYFSHRAVLVDFKCFAFTDSGIARWRKRLGDLLGMPVSERTSWRGDLDGPFFRRSAADLERIAREYGATHVLTRTGANRGLHGHIILEDRGWVLYQLDLPSD